MSVDYDFAKGVAEDFLARRPPTQGIPCKLLESETIETEWGFVFAYQSAAYVDTGAVSSMLHAPSTLVVLKKTGALYEEGAEEEIDAFLHELQTWRGNLSGVLRPFDVRAEVTLFPTSEDGRKGPIFSEYRPHFAIRANYQTSGVITLIEKNTLPPGHTSLAEITFLTPAVYPRSV